tara:strand:- start:142 stop:597 length:456 start_codon:yes stop_codon:yes gene_type:complete
MSFLEELGAPVVEIDETEFNVKIKKISPFDFANSINFTKENLIIDEDTENQYNPFIVNRAMGFSADTVIPANEMNSRPHIDNKMQYDFLCGVVRKSKRYSKWIKSEEEDLEAIQEYFAYSFNKAKEALRILSSDDIVAIKNILIRSKGGKL